MSDNEYQHVDIRQARQLAYRIVDLIQTDPRAVQVASVMMLVSALSKNEQDVVGLLYESDYMLDHASKVQPAETQALLQYVKQCMIK